MAKKIRFSLEMNEGVMVGSVEALRENFSLPQVLSYLSNGKLVTWLRDRYEDDLAEAIEGLDKEDPELAKKVCGIFDVEYSEQDEIDLEKAMERDRKLKMLKEYTSEQKFIDHIDQIAFTQDDLYDLLDEDESEIYLCGEEFTIPLAKKGVHYIGINHPVVVINSKQVVDWEAKGIQLMDVVYDDRYQKIVNMLSTPIVTYHVHIEEYENSRYTTVRGKNHKIYLDDEKGTHVKTVSEEAFCVKKYENKIYYVVVKDDYSRELHIYDVATQKEDIDHAFTNRWLYDIKSCTNEFIICVNNLSQVLVYDIRNKRFGDELGSSNHSLITDESLYTFGDKGKIINKYNLKTMEKVKKQISVLNSEIRSIVSGDGGLVCLYRWYEFNGDVYHLAKISYDLKEIIYDFKIPSYIYPDEDYTMTAFAENKGRIYYICLPVGPGYYDGELYCFNTSKKAGDLVFRISPRGTSQISAETVDTKLQIENDVLQYEICDKLLAGNVIVKESVPLKQLDSELQEYACIEEW